MKNLIDKLSRFTELYTTKFGSFKMLFAFFTPMWLIGLLVAVWFGAKLNAYDIESKYKYALNTVTSNALCDESKHSEQVCQEKLTHIRQLVAGGAIENIKETTNKHFEGMFAPLVVQPDVLKETSAARWDSHIKMFGYAIQAESDREKPDAKRIANLKEAVSLLEETKAKNTQIIDKFHLYWLLLILPIPQLCWALFRLLSKVTRRLNLEDAQKA